MQNAKRIFARIMHEIARERGIELDVFSSDWLFHFRHAGKSRYALGYDFELNSATAQLIAKDKSATSDLLQLHKIPRVEHVIFFSPEMKNYLPSNGNWQPMLEYARRDNFDVVAKPNKGTGGMDVFRVRNESELEEVSHKLFTKTRSLCLSPFYEIQGEYRIIVFRGECVLAYAKIRPKIVGDGMHSKLALLSELMNRDPHLANLLSADEGDFAGITGLNDILPAGQTQTLNWRHNLGQGGGVEVISSQRCRDLGLDQLAIRAAGAIGLAVGAVDIIETAHQHLVLEINSGLMMERFAVLAENGYEIAKRIYDRVICAMFDLHA